jgi:hypothetical protein
MELHHLIDLQSAILDDYLHNVWTTFGMYVAAIGWIITSDKSRSFLRINLVARVAVVLAAVLILAIEIRILFFLQHKSESLYNYIQTCNLWNLYVGQNKQTSNLIVLEIRHITILFPIISSIIAAILCFSFIIMIVHLKESRDTVGQSRK